MIAIPGNVRVWLATGHTDMRRGFRSLALMVQEELKRDPHCGDLSFSPDVEATWSKSFGTTARCMLIFEASRPQALLVAVDGGRRCYNQRCSGLVSLVRN
jgi:hypothetical protein